MKQQTGEGESPRGARPRSWTRALVVVGATALVGGIGLVAAEVVPYLREPDVNAGRFAYVPRPEGPPPVLWPLPAFELLDQQRSKVSLASLRGEPFIANFIFTQCTSACPMMTSRMVKLQRSLQGSELRFVSFSVDPAHDTPEALAAYAKSWNASETRWSLLATDEPALKAVTQGFRVVAQPTGDSADPILHSEYFFLVDGEGRVRGVYSSSDPDAVARLTADARQLASSRGHAAPLGHSYASLGCAGCHDNARVAPPLVNLIGAERTLSDGAKVRIDEAYLKRSILEPGKQLVAGYLPLMPSYADQLSDAELSMLIHDLRLRTSEAPSGSTEAELVVDPVCHMRVRATPDALHLTHDGAEVYFCSESCRDQYQVDPKRFPLEPAP